MKTHLQLTIPNPTKLNEDRDDLPRFAESNKIFYQIYQHSRKEFFVFLRRQLLWSERLAQQI